MQSVAMAAFPKPHRQRHRHFIKEWRRYRGLTQEQLAERLDMSRPNFSRIERGLTPYNQDVLEMMAEALRCEPADLLMRDPNSPVWSLYDAFREIPADRQSMALTLIEALRKAS
jgi:transcriptional regulator with XRE-family HTH domain